MSEHDRLHRPPRVSPHVARRLRARAARASIASTVLAVAPVAQSFVECTRVLHTLDGESAGDQFGWVSAPVPDIDGDGVSEVIVGAPTAPFSGRGKIYVYSGLTAAELFQAEGPSGSLLGNSVRAAGDVDGDGVCDVIAGAPGSFGPGRAFVYSGADGSVIFTLQEGGSGSSYGDAVAGLGDVTDDGVPDLAVGATGIDGGAGRVYVHSGCDGSIVWEIDGEAAGDNFGSGVASALDVTGDGREDLVVGAPGGGTANRGKAYVYDVANQVLLWDAEAAPTGVNFGQFFVAGVGDASGDGVSDVYVGDFNDTTSGPGTGRAYLFDGVTGDELFSVPGDDANDGFGIGRGAGDVDGDGRADLLMCSWVDDDGALDAGQAKVLSGLDGSVLRVITSATPGDTFGFDAHGMGDVDGDGRLDYFVTAAWNDELGNDRGRCYLVAGGIPVESVGEGLAGTAGLVPTLTASGCPELGAAMTIDVAIGLGGAAGAVAFGTTAAEVPLLGGKLWLVPLGSVPSTLGGPPGVPGLGSASHPFTVPSSPAFAGSELHLQGFYFDGLAPFGVSMTSGLRLILG